MADYHPPSLDPTQEQELVRAAQRGEKEAMAILLRSVERILYNLCFRLLNKREEDAQDCFHDALCKIIEKINGFKGGSTFLTWAYKVTENVCKSWQRREKRRTSLSLDSPAQKPSAGENDTLGSLIPDSSREPSVLSGIERRQEQERLLDVLQGLEEHHREILCLRYIESFTEKQMSEILEVPVGTIKSRLNRAITALTKLMEKSPGPRTLPRAPESAL